MVDVAKKMSKRMKRAYSVVDVDRVYSMTQALDVVSQYSEVGAVKFDESVDVAVSFNLDTRQSDQMLRGAVPMPHGLGKAVKVLVFVSDDKLGIAKESGADLFGSMDLIEDIKVGKIALDFDVCISTSNMMPHLAKIGKILGPKGLMPNPKLGTVSDDVVGAVKLAKAGRAEYRTDKSGIVHASIGRISFSANNLMDNIKALYDVLIASKPSGVKGSYVKNFYLSTSMGPSIKVDINKIYE